MGLINYIKDHMIPKDHMISLGVGAGIGALSGMVVGLVTAVTGIAAGFGITLGAATTMVVAIGFGGVAFATFVAATVIGAIAAGATAEPLEKTFEIKFKPWMALAGIIAAQTLVVGAILMGTGEFSTNNNPDADENSAPPISDLVMPEESVTKTSRLALITPLNESTSVLPAAPPDDVTTKAPVPYPVLKL